VSGGHKAPGGGHKKHAAHDEEHENHERWLVSYADMMTLLMVLFVVLFAMSQVDAAKFAALADGLAKGFGSPTVALTGPGTKIQDSTDATAPVNLGGTAGKDAPQSTVDSEDPALKKAVQDADRARQQRMQEHAQQEVRNFDQVKSQILQAAAKQGMADSVKFTVDERGLVVTLVTSEVVFAGDRADLLPAGQHVLDAVAPTLATLPNKLEVDGHTNQLPVPTVNYPSAWELSSARASTVVRYLIDHGHLPAARLSAAGFAGEKPLYPPSDPRAAALNRRVEIIVLSSLPAAERALLPSAAGTSAHE
jgi:chemotaxis protein MotB